MAKIAYSYVRFSRPEQLKGDSLRRQLDAGKAWAEKHGYTLDDSLKLLDKGISAFKGANAAKGKLGAFLAAVESGRVKPGAVLLIESLDRLSRNQVGEALELFLGILRRGIKIVTLSPPETFDSKSINEVVNLMAAIISLSRAHEESEMKSVRLKEAWKNKRAKLGTIKMTKRAPMWLELAEDRKSYSIKKEAGATVKRIVQMALAGVGVVPIVKKLTRDGVKPLGFAEVWHTSTILKILHNRSLIGEFQPGTGTTGNRKPHGAPIPNYYPAIITEAQFYAIQQALSARKYQTGPRGKNVTSLFTGLLKCVDTQSSVVIVDKDGKRLVSSAAKRGEAKFISFPYPVWEGEFLKWCSEVDPADLIPFDDSAAQSQNELTAVLGKQADLQSRIKSIKARMATDANFDALLDVLSDLEKQRKLLDATIEQLKTELHRSADVVLHDTKEIIGMLAESEGQELMDLRTTLKARLSALISEIWVAIRQDSKTARSLVAEIRFQSGGCKFLHMGTLTEYTGGGLSNPMPSTRVWSVAGNRDGADSVVVEGAPTWHQSPMFDRSNSIIQAGVLVAQRMGVDLPSRMAQNSA